MLPDSFKALRIHQHGAGVQPRVESLALDDLAPGEVVVRVKYSSINYKDALAATGKGRILRRFPLVGGIDLAGEVIACSDSSIELGRRVLVTGCGLSETHDGGYAEFARVRSEWVIPVPPGLDEFQCMALGTAGFTAALAIQRMEDNGLAPGTGTLIVTGASGGVGSLALDMLSGRGYTCAALTSKHSSVDYLRALGARHVLLRSEFQLGSKPLEEARWAGAIDNVGGDVLAALLRAMQPGASVASVGMAASPELTTTVFPFILRGVNVLGINSVNTPRVLRLAIWQRLATDLRPRNLDRIVTRVVDFEALPEAFDDLIKAQQLGRTVVRIGCSPA